MFKSHAFQKIKVTQTVLRKEKVHLNNSGNTHVDKVLLVQVKENLTSETVPVAVGQKLLLHCTTCCEIGSQTEVLPGSAATPTLPDTLVCGLEGWLDNCARSTGRWEQHVECGR